MIADLDETIRKLIIEELPIKNGEIDIQFDQPNREWSAKLSKPTVNLFLYDLRENPVLRTHQWERIGKGNGRVSQKRTPMRVDCFYMLTAWANDPGDEHRLLTRSLMTLYRFPILPSDRLEGTLQNPIFDIQTRLASHDKLTNPAEVWSSLDNEMRPSLPYIVTLALDPWSEVTGPPVRTFTLRAGQAAELPRYQRFMEGTLPDEMIYIGGTVRAKSKSHEPIPDVEVAIKGTGHFTTTDQDGRFRLGSIPAGDYTLVTWHKKGKPDEVTITVPGDDGNYDIEV